MSREETPSANVPTEPTRPARLRSWQALLLFFGGGLVPFLILASERRVPGGLVLGFFGCCVSAVGALALARRGTETDEDPVDESRRVGARSLIAPLGWLALALSLHVAVVVLAVAGLIPVQPVLAGLLIPASIVGMTVAAYRLLEALGAYAPVHPSEARRPLWQRHGFWLIVLTTGLYVPTLGNFALLDPWETHYGEVAREMLARNDWISLWWAQDGWFWSKPILNFWAQGLSFQLFGVEYQPDQMIASILQGRTPQPEWAARLPIFWMALAAGYTLYKASALAFGRRAALLGGIVLVTSPHWLLLARQTMADMPYVAPLTVALALQLIAFNTDPEQRVRHYEVRLGRRRLRFSAFDFLFGLILLCVLPQVLYLLTRNVTLHLGDPFGFRVHLDEFSRGSGGGNCGQPGNRSCAAASAVYDWGQPSLWAVLWLASGLGLLLWNRKERRTQRLLFLGAWFATALSVMAKGAPGFVLPVAAAVAYPIVTGRPKQLLRMELPALALLTMCVALPWYVQTFMRHGMPFFERLVLHDMVNRAFAHVHDTNKGDDVSFRYYVWQLGYGLFPWTGLAGIGVVWWARRKERPDTIPSNASIFLTVWVLAAFGMFSLTLTKFHHYILPLVPPSAAFAGVLLQRYFPRRLSTTPGRTTTYYAGLLAASALCFYGLLRLFPGSLSGHVPGDTPHPPMVWVAALCLVVGLAVLVVVARFFGPSPRPSRPSRLHPVLAAVAIASVVAVVLAGRDMAVTSPRDVEGQIRLLHLVTYNYDRPWPDVLDFRGALWAFTILCSGSILCLAIWRIRHHVAGFFFASAIVWGAWVCGVYVMGITPHWSQRNTMSVYYEQREDESEPLVAYQMNWKGENFYTGNRMATFVSTGSKFKRWLKRERKRGTDTMFFTTEHTRINGLKKELGKVESFEKLTDESFNNKFFLAKAVFPPWNDKDDDKDDDEKPKKKK